MPFGTKYGDNFESDSASKFSKATFNKLRGVKIHNPTMAKAET